MNYSILDNNLNDQISYARFFSAFGYSDSDNIYLRRFYDPDSQSKEHLPANSWQPLSNIESLVKSMKGLNKEGYGIFFSVNGGVGNQSVIQNSIVRAYSMEIDDFGFYEQIDLLNDWNEKTDCPPSIIIKTKKSLHCYWLVGQDPEYRGESKAKEWEYFRPRQRALIQIFHSDPSIKTEEHVMRLYGFNHCKDPENPVEVVLIKFDPGSVYTIDGLDKGFKEVYGIDIEDLKEGNPNQKGNCQTIDYVESDGGKIQHPRHLDLIRELGYLAKCGRYSFDEICNMLWVRTCTRHDPPLSKDNFEESICRQGKKYFDKARTDPEWTPPRTITELQIEYDQQLNCSVVDELIPLSLTHFEEKKVDWLVDGYIPKRCITIMGADGGAGKTSVWCNIAGALSAGRFTMFDHEKIEKGYKPPDPQKVMFFSSEDAIEEVLLKRLKSAGANPDNIVTVPLSDERFGEIKYNSEILRRLIERERPSLIIFDPLQSFISPKVKMGERNAMRSELNPLIGFCSVYDTTVLIISHANKQAGAWGRKRLADSADIWDIARSVLMLGETGENNTRYISHEKCNYGQTAPTILFNTTGGVANYEGCTDKKDKDFVCNVVYAKKEAPKLDTAKEMILDIVHDEPVQECELKRSMKANGVTESTYRNAKEKLRDEGKIRVYSEGYGKEKKWFVTEVIPDNENPFN